MLRARPILKLLARLLPELYSTRSTYYYKLSLTFYLVMKFVVVKLNLFLRRQESGMVISLIDTLANGKNKTTALVKENLRKCKRDIFRRVI